jgi:hypothetical protein
MSRINQAGANGFLRAIQIRSTPSFEAEVKPDVTYRKTKRHVKELYEYELNISQTKSIISFAQILPICY